MNSKKDMSLLSEAEWQNRLSPEQYYILRRKGTERPFTGPFWDHYELGTYTCTACDNNLFKSHSKFDAGCGWPSFFEPISAQALTEHEDFSHGMVRVEIRCGGCGGHLGHVFDDGPQPTGLRYCMNGTALKFTPDNG
ncbi:peptide-methionine (R)-S-oxide reductase [Rhodobacteraceae bacterium RKSG542]|uniref:peptide-methionine (R)-S-oxide reductase MsrB n=1 Tax=Pseudovibrio flavus TaxID=2529854 RepID=UPI0012BC03FC|nr:peptide-methionine (R)-S-oxide reductase MsrB [Pseudovibrio flavus]MTI18935.1 peptide-methionine (R)-S-oxide reductase [Pseudovibrio flavus]